MKMKQNTWLAGVCCAAVLFAGLVSQAYCAPVQWQVGDGGNGHSYEVVAVAGGILWDDARLAAEAAGGYLAVVTSQEENDFIFALADPIAEVWDDSGINTLGPWLGASDADDENTWVWVTGEPFSYHPWGPSQPNHNGDYLNIYGLGDAHGSIWNDFDDEVPGYVIEWVPEPATFSLLALASLAMLRRKRSA
jgi:Lectin C-type domain/PEP-CTERM motif